MPIKRAAQEVQTTWYMLQKRVKCTGASLPIIQWTRSWLACRLTAWAGSCSFLDTNSSCGWLWWWGSRFFRSSFYLGSLFSLLLLCLHYRLLPWSAQLSSWTRSRKSIRRSILTTQLCTKKAEGFSILIPHLHKRPIAGHLNSSVFTCLFVNCWL